VPLRSAAPSAGPGREAGGPLLVPLSPKENDSDDDSDVRIVSSIGDAPRGPSPTAFGLEARQDEGKSSSTSTSSSSSSYDGTEQSASPSATVAEKDDFAAAAEEHNEEEPVSSSYWVTPEEPRAAAVRLQVPAEAKLIGGKQIRFLCLTSGEHERKFLEEAGSSFTIPHEEEYFGKLSSSELTTACGDLSLKAFVASRCLAQRLEQESKEAKELSTAANASLQNRVAELEGRLAAEQEQNRKLLQAKEDAAKSSEAALEALRLDVEALNNAKEDLHAQLIDKEAKLAEAQKEASELSGVLERYRADHIRSAETLRTDILELLGQCNLGAPPIPFPQCTVEAFYEWVNACFDLIAMNTKIFGELGAVVGVRTLAYSVCSLVPADRPSSEKTISKGDLRRLSKDNFEWPTDAELDVAQLPVLAKNLAKNFMNTFFAQRGFRLTLDESVRLSAQVRRSHFYFRFKTLLVVSTLTHADILPSVFRR
jgi:chemotaxis protein histidine kinase CheA